MKPYKHFVSTLLLVTGLCFSTNSFAEDLPSQSSNIFKFQHKLATNGNVYAQYKLAAMYESGDGVEASTDKAKYWYNLATEAGSKPAMHRGTYLEIKEKGYDPVKHADWLNSVKTEAAAHQAESMYLLGQLYGQGVGVEKDLSKSLELFKQVRILGVGNVDSQIVSIQEEMAASKRAEQQRDIQREEEVARLKRDEVTQQAKLEAVKVQQAQDKVEAAESSQAEKIRRYERAMMQLQLEQKQIDEQQSWATGGAIATAEDEI